ncbi:hypothetical protein C7M84_017408 [Penaeus vannamei]|uniref:C2H2-type domain-containing protein n=1 Tax=Penaeus vannamei TaxID=6689 RepID=A0A423SK72_PENVA|nr:hypothetical protein C7M84_017408 [Penaeus vannamei]
MKRTAVESPAASPLRAGRGSWPRALAFTHDRAKTSPTSTKKLRGISWCLSNHSTRSTAFLTSWVFSFPQGPREPRRSGLLALMNSFDGGRCHTLILNACNDVGCSYAGLGPRGLRVRLSDARRTLAGGARQDAACEEKVLGRTPLRLRHVAQSPSLKGQKYLLRSSGWTSTQNCCACLRLTDDALAPSSYTEAPTAQDPSVEIPVTEASDVDCDLSSLAGPLYLIPALVSGRASLDASPSSLLVYVVSTSPDPFSGAPLPVPRPLAAPATSPLPQTAPRKRSRPLNSPRTYKCFVCQKLYDSRYKLKLHMSSHSALPNTYPYILLGDLRKLSETKAPTPAHPRLPHLPYLRPPSPLTSPMKVRESLDSSDILLQLQRGLRSHLGIASHNPEPSRTGRPSSPAASPLRAGRWLLASSQNFSKINKEVTWNLSVSRQQQPRGILVEVLLQITCRDGRFPNALIASSKEE